MDENIVMVEALLNTVITACMKENPKNLENPIFPGFWICPDKIITMQKREGVYLYNPLDSQEDLMVKNLNISTIANYLNHRQRIFVRNLNQDNEYPNNKGYLIIYVENTPASVHPSLSDKMPREFLELNIRYLYPRDSIEGKSIIDKYKIMPRNSSEFDAKYFIIEEQYANSEDIIYDKLLRHDYFRGLHSDTLETLSGIPSTKDAVSKYLCKVEHLTSAGGIKVLSFAQLGLDVFGSFASIYGGTESTSSLAQYSIANMKTSFKGDYIIPDKPGIYLASNANTSEILQALYPNNNKSAISNTKVKEIRCLAITSRKSTVNNPYIILDTVDPKAKNTKGGVMAVNMVDAIRDKIQSLTGIYTHFIIDGMHTLPHDILLELSQKTVIILDQFTNLMALSNKLPQEATLRECMIDNLVAYYEPMHNICIPFNDSIRFLLNSKSRLLPDLSFSPVIGIQTDENGTSDLTLHDLIQYGLSQANHVVINHNKAYMIKKNTYSELNDYNLSYTLQENSLLQYILSLPVVSGNLDYRSFFNMSQNKFTQSVILKTFFDKNNNPIEVRCTVIKADGHCSLEFEKLNTPIKYDMSYIDSAVNQILSELRGIYFLSSPAHGGKKTLLKYIISKLPNIASTKVLVVDPDMYITKNTFNLPEVNLNITRSIDGIETIIKNLQPTIIIFTRLSNPSLAKNLLKITSPTQATIILSNHRYLANILKELYVDDSTQKECITRFFSMAVTQQLVDLGDGNCIPITEIINDEELRNAILQSSGLRGREDASINSIVDSFYKSMAVNYETQLDFIKEKYPKCKDFIYRRNRS